MNGLIKIALIALITLQAFTLMGSPNQAHASAYFSTYGLGWGLGFGNPWFYGYGWRPCPPTLPVYKTDPHLYEKLKEMGEQQRLAWLRTRKLLAENNRIAPSIENIEPESLPLEVPPITDIPNQPEVNNAP